MDISTLYDYNPWWADIEAIRSDSKVKEAFSKKQKKLYEFEPKNILLIGPRQVGKTTFLKLVIYDLIINKQADPRSIFYFSCDILKKAEDIKSVIDAFIHLPLPRKGAVLYFFLDEISFVEDWNVQIKALLDLGIFDKNYIYMTGSSSVSLKKERFPGRNIVIKEFLPLSFKEYTYLFGSDELKRELKTTKFDINSIYENIVKISPYFTEIQTRFSNYLNSGGFLLSAYNLLEDKDLSSAYEIYWATLIGDISRINRNARIVQSVIQGIIKNYGSLYSFNSIAKEMEIGSHVTVREYLELLEQLFVIYNIYQFDFPRSKILFSHFRKTYFIDPFLYHTVLTKLYNKAIDESKIPSLLEGVVASNLKKSFNTLYLIKQKKEVDFYVPGENGFGVEVKSGKATFSDFKYSNLKHKIVLSRDRFEKGEGRVVVPYSLFLLIL